MSACVQEPEVADSSLQSGPVEDISLVASFTGSTPIPLGNHIITIFIIYQQFTPFIYGSLTLKDMTQ